MRSARRASRSATNSSTPSLAISEGWIWMGPKPTQRVAPLAVMPTPGTSTAMSPARESSSANRAWRRHHDTST